MALTFPAPFAHPPVVLLTARGKNHVDTFVVSTREVTTTGCKVNIVRVDGGGGWGQKLELDWIAMPLDVGALFIAGNQLAPPPAHAHALGVEETGGSGSGSGKKRLVRHEMGMTYSRLEAIRFCERQGGRLAKQEELFDKKRDKLLVNHGKPYPGSHWTPVLGGGSDPSNDLDVRGWVQVGNNGNTHGSGGPEADPLEHWKNRKPSWRVGKSYVEGHPWSNGYNAKVDEVGNKGGCKSPHVWCVMFPTEEMKEEDAAQVASENVKAVRELERQDSVREEAKSFKNGRKKRDNRIPQWDVKKSPAERQAAGKALTTIVFMSGAGGLQWGENPEDIHSGPCFILDRISPFVEKHPTAQLLRLDTISNKGEIGEGRNNFGSLVGTNQTRLWLEREGLVCVGNRIILLCNSMSGGIAPTIALWLHDQGVVVVSVVFIASQSKFTNCVKDFPPHISVYAFHGDSDEILTAEKNGGCIVELAKRQPMRLTDYVLMPGGDHCHCMATPM
jgi:hypothetical protein